MRNSTGQKKTPVASSTNNCNSKEKEGRWSLKTKRNLKDRLPNARYRLCLDCNGNQPTLKKAQNIMRQLTKFKHRLDS